MPQHTHLVIVLGCLTAGIFLGVAYKQRATTSPVASQKSSTLTEQLIVRLEDTRAQPTGTTSTVLDIQLAQAYLQQVRETADAALYNKIDTLMNEAAKKNPNDVDVTVVRATIAAGRHYFQESLGLTQQALAQDPTRADVRGLLVDNLTELGRYDEAAHALQTMVNARPDLASFQRIAYQRELRGDVEGALEALEAALAVGSRVPEHTAWTRVERANLVTRRDLDQARQEYTRAQDIMSRAYPPALAGLGRVAFFQGHATSALAYFEQALQALPVTHHAIDLGDVYLVTDDNTKAQQYYALANLAFEASSSSGVNVDLEHALFLADHDLLLPLALEKARRAYRERPSIFGADVLAWTLYKNGDVTSAKKFIREALRLGEHDPLILFHAGVIAKANGQTTEAKRLLQKALDIHPHFSIQHARTAQDTLRSL